MRINLLPRRKAVRLLLNLVLTVILLFSNSPAVLASDAGTLAEIRSLLKTQYVEPVADEVLNASTIEEMLDKLGDPHTMYFTPEEYHQFVESINLSFTGIGIHMEMVPEGVAVLSVVSGSPAEEAGLKSGDVIVQADGESMAGLTSEEAVNKLRGPEGSTVRLRVNRGEEILDLKATRAEVSEPTITGEVLDGHIGYLDLNSFGEDTPEEFETAVKKLEGEKVDSWIVDLRDNGGGYLSSALDLAGYFIGGDTAVRFKDRSGELYPYEAIEHDFTLGPKIIVLINENSASASEILTAAVKDYEKAVIVGTTSYGKGSVQSMFPLDNGGVLKMTVDHFYSPLGKEIDKVGVSPNVLIQQADSLKAAELMLSDSAQELKMARTDDYWEAWRELSGTAANNAGQSSSSYIYYYPSYRQVADLAQIPLDKKFTVDFSEAIDWTSVNNSSVELIDSSTGERTLSTFQPQGAARVEVIPNTRLTPDTTYWLVIHPTIRGLKGKVLNEGGLTIAHTLGGGEGSGGTSQIQSIKVQQNPLGSDYGVAIKDLEKR